MGEASRVAVHIEFCVRCAVYIVRAISARVCDAQLGHWVFSHLVLPPVGRTQTGGTGKTKEMFSA